MEKKKILSAVSVVLIALSCCGCGKTQSVSSGGEPPIQSAVNSATAAEDRIFPGVEKLTLDYRTVMSPVIYGRTLYMSVSEERTPREDCDTRHIVSYNIDTGKTEYLYESAYDSAYIQQISCDGKWLVWVDQEIGGAACDICVMNLESGEIKKIDNMQPEAPAFMIPKLQNERVYWIKEEHYSERDNKISGSVYEYDCVTKKKRKIASLNYIDFYNISLSVGNGKAIWSETVNDKGTLFLYDIKSQKTEKYVTGFKYACAPLYTDGYAIFQGQNTFDNGFEQPNRNYWYNIKTGETTEVKALDSVMIAASDNFLATSCGTVIYYYKRDGEKLTLLEPYTAVRGDCKFSENDIFINAREDENKTIVYINNLKDFATK